MEERSTADNTLYEPECKIENVDADEYLRDPLKLEPSDMECGEPSDMECGEPSDTECGEPCGNVYDALFEVHEHAVVVSSGVAHRDSAMDAAGAHYRAARSERPSKRGCTRRSGVGGSSPTDTLTTAQGCGPGLTTGRGRGLGLTTARGRGLELITARGCGQRLTTSRGCGQQTQPGTAVCPGCETTSPAVASSSGLNAEAVSTSRSRSASPTPGPQRQLAAQRAIMMNLALDNPQEANLIPPRPQAVPASQVSAISGGSYNVRVDPAQQMPGGSISRVMLPSLCGADIIECVESLDMSDEDFEDTIEENPWHVARWLKNSSTSRHLSPISSVEPPLANVSGAFRIPHQNPTSVISVAKDASAADTIPSTSGMVAVFKPSTNMTKGGDGSDIDSEFDDEFDDPTDCATVLAGLDRNIPDDEQLDQPEKNVLYAVERALDEAADRLGVSTSFDWVDNYESFRGAPEIFSGPTPGPLVEYDKPYDAFVDIWNKDIIELIVRETNRYALQAIYNKGAKRNLKPSSRLRKWTPTNADEIMCLFAVYMYMALDPRPSQNEYWMRGDFLEMPKFGTLMSYDRYILLNKFLHFVDNSDVSQNVSHSERDTLSPRLAKLKPVILHLNKKFSSLYNLESEIALDESLTLYKGRLCWVETIKTKAARFGIKSYELCESRTGYLYKFQIYTGKNSADTSSADDAPCTDLGSKSTKVVLDLLETLKHRGHRVTMDNFHNCPALARYLKSLGFDCLGPLRPNRKNVPDAISQFPKNAPKGTIIARHCGDVSIVAWKDFRMVTMISTYHTDETYIGSRSGEPLVKPVCVRDYNKTMGGVDLKDQKLSMYLLERKRGVKWYVKMFRRLLNVSIHNAYVMTASSLVRRDKLPMTHREFRFALAKSLADNHLRPPQPTASDVQRALLRQSLMRLRKDIMHEPQTEPRTKRMRCRVCLQRKKRSMVRTRCVTCEAFLCFGTCWREWHSLKVINQQETQEW